jgi:hypothetical protein
LRYFPIRLWLAIFLVLTALAYTGLFLSLSDPPFIDAPNHLARAVIMDSLWSKPHSPFQNQFSAGHIFVPYMLPDLGLIFLIRLLGIHLAYTIWSTLTMLVLVLAIWIYARQILATSWALAAAILCAWYFATSYYLILGFFAFQWGLAAAFLALAALEAWRRNERTRIPWVALYAVACFACYAAHIAVFAILAAMVGAVGLIRVLRKEQSWMRFALELLPFALLATYHFPLVPAIPAAADGTTQIPIAGTLGNLLGSTFLHSNYLMGGLIQILGGGILAGASWFKLGNFLVGMFIRQNYWMDGTLLTLFWGIIAGTIWNGRKQADLRTYWPLATICGLAATLYFLLPFWWQAVAYVDQRALPFFFISLLMLSLQIFESSKPNQKQIAYLMLACSSLAVLNLASLALFLPRQSRQVRLYREALLTVPENRVVLPVDTRRRDGNTFPLRHAGAFYAADRHGYTPYIFSNKTGSGPSEYFSDLSSIYHPLQGWYRRNAPCDWEKVNESYDYVIITKPWRANRLDLSRLELHYENSVATVFRVRRLAPAATP